MCGEAYRFFKVAGGKAGVYSYEPCQIIHNLKVVRSKTQGLFKICDGLFNFAHLKECKSEATCLSDEDPPNEKYIKIDEGPRVSVYFVPELVRKLKDIAWNCSDLSEYKISIYDTLDDLGIKDVMIFSDGVDDALMPKWHITPKYEYRRWVTLYDVMESVIENMDEQKKALYRVTKDVHVPEVSIPENPDYEDYINIDENHEGMTVRRVYYVPNISIDVKDIIYITTGRPRGKIVPDARLKEDLGMHEKDIKYLLRNCNNYNYKGLKRFGTIPVDEINDWETVADVVLSVFKAMPQREMFRVPSEMVPK